MPRVIIIRRTVQVPGTTIYNWDNFPQNLRML